MGAVLQRGPGVEVEMEDRKNAQASGTHELDQAISHEATGRAPPHSRQIFQQVFRADFGLSEPSIVATTLYILVDQRK